MTPDFAGKSLGISGRPLTDRTTRDTLPPQERVKAFKKEHGSAVLGQVTVDQAIGGMRGIPGLYWETSLLDADEGIRFRGYSIPELQSSLPGAKEGGEPLPEGLLWLLFTGDIPTKSQARGMYQTRPMRAGTCSSLFALRSLARRASLARQG